MPNTALIRADGSNKAPSEVRANCREQPRADRRKRKAEKAAERHKDLSRR